MYCKVGAKKALILTMAFKGKAGTYLAWGATLLVSILAGCGIPAVGPGLDDEVYASPSASSKQAVKSYEGYSREEVEAFLNPSSQSSEPDVAPVFSGLPCRNTPTSKITTNKVPNFWLPLATATLSPATPDCQHQGRHCLPLLPTWCRLLRRFGRLLQRL